MNNLNSNATMSGANSLNNVKLIGSIASKAYFSHEVAEKNEAGNTNIIFLRFTLEVPRLSGASDFLDIVIPKKTWLEFFNGLEYIPGTDFPKTVVEISGRLQSHNGIDPKTGKGKLDLFVFAKGIRTLIKTKADNDVDNNIAAELGNNECLNTVTVEGFLCKTPVVRRTRLGRVIADLFIAVNRSGHSSYIPVILWGGNAVNAKNFKIGDKIRLTGRFQSREYKKDIDGIMVTHMAYELSASSVKLSEKDMCSHF